jgi:hypothetical protein
MSAIAGSVHVTMVDAGVVPTVNIAIGEFRADIVLLLTGSVDSDSEVATSLQEILRGSPVPVSVLYAPARVMLATSAL